MVAGLWLEERPMAMGQHVAGRVRKLSLYPRDALLALFEAVANSIDAIETSGVGSRVLVRVLRDGVTPVMASKKEKVGRHPLIGFEVEDDGPGFTDQNLNSFKLADFTHKVAIGAKGEGRFSWLKVFKLAEIESSFDSGEGRSLRCFRFSESDDGVGDEQETVTTLPRVTRVRLTKPHPRFEKKLCMDPEQLAQEMLQHYIVYFLSKPSVTVTLVDSSTDYQEELCDLFKREMGQIVTSIPFELNNLEFMPHHFTDPKPGGKNTVTLCAAKRAVTDIDMASISVDLGEPLEGEHGNRRNYRIAITSPYLDLIVDGERTGFKFPSDASYSQPDEVTRRELLEKISDIAEDQQRDHLDRLRASKAHRVERIVAEQCPHLRPFLEDAKPRLNNLPVGSNERQIEIALYETKVESRERMEKFVKDLVASSAPHQQIQKRAEALSERFVNEATRHNQSALAEYVCTRRAVIDVLSASLSTDETNTHQFEAFLHNLFFPMKKTSAEVPVGSDEPACRSLENLWLLDERLVFHHLCASDLPLNQLRGLLNSKTDEPDIAIFQPAFMTTEDDLFQTVTLIEFKRPGRDDYKDGEKHNPIQQLIGLARKLRNGEFQDVTGRRHRLPAGTMIYGYAVCDITDKLKEIIDNSLDMTMTADRQGYYYYHKGVGMLIEVLSYEKLIRNARQRNAGFSRWLQMD